MAGLPVLVKAIRQCYVVSSTAATSSVGVPASHSLRQSVRDLFLLHERWVAEHVFLGVGSIGIGKGIGG